MMLPSLENNNKLLYLHTLSKGSISVYWALIAGVATALAVLPFLTTDVAIRAPGIIRPVQERTEIKAMTGGMIDSLYYGEGQLVPQGALIAKLRDDQTGSRKVQLQFEIDQRRQFLHDLHLLLSTPALTQAVHAQLSSSLYRQQVNRFLYRQAEQQALLDKVQNEWRIDSSLAADKVIAPKELFDKKVEQAKLQAAFLALKQEQLSIWQQDRVKYRLELSQLEGQQAQLVSDAAQYEIKAPVSGVLQGINTRYAGGFLGAGETVGVLSPEAGLIAECYVPSQDVGLLKVNNEVKLQVDAFDANYFGVLTGNVVGIDNDFTVIDNKPVFKVRCLFHKKQLHLKNGYAGQLKKGMTVQARFIVARRSLWQLLFDKLDDWANPNKG
jgi:HlyD family secretion protein